MVQGGPAIYGLREGAVLGGDFVIGRQLGRGGMGTVYEAQQLSTGRPRAVKVLHPELARDPRVCERFIEEARVPAKIDSPYLCETIAAGNDPTSGVLYIAMELLRGETLAARIARAGPLEPQLVYPILAEVVAGLGAAHKAGYVHRDLKPENVFLVEGGAQRIKILDFGVAKSVGLKGSATTMSVGSPLWMAPEQAEGRHVRPSTDVWALGLVVFNMLTGETYWMTTRALGGTVPSLLMEILTHEMPPASSRTRAPLPAGFDAWFARAVCRDPAGRYPDAESAWLALEPLLRPLADVTMRSGGPSPLAPAGPAGRDRVQSSLAYGPTQFHNTAPPPSASSRVALIVVAAVMLLLAGGAGVYFAASHRAELADSRSPKRSKEKSGAPSDRDETDETDETTSPKDQSGPHVLADEDDACPVNGANILDCQCKRKQCNWACPKGGCSVRAEPKSKVLGDCSGGSCMIECAKGSECNVACGNGCMMTCEAGATCSFNCKRGCVFECDPKAASCKHHCENGGCVDASGF